MSKDSYMFWLLKLSMIRPYITDVLLTLHIFLDVKRQLRVLFTKVTHDQAIHKRNCMAWPWVPLVTKTFSWFFLTTKNICCVARSFVCFILVLEHNKHELPQNFEIVASIVLVSWNNCLHYFWRGHQFLLCWCCWHFHYSVSAVCCLNYFGTCSHFTNHTEQIWRDIGSRNCKNAKLIHKAVTVK